MGTVRRQIPPEGFVPITQARWDALCAQLGVNRAVREVPRLAWRASRMWFVDPRGYRERVGEWPPGYVPPIC